MSFHGLLLGFKWQRLIDVGIGAVGLYDLYFRGLVSLEHIIGGLGSIGLRSAAGYHYLCPLKGIFAGDVQKG